MGSRDRAPGATEETDEREKTSVYLPGVDLLPVASPAAGLGRRDHRGGRRRSIAN